MGQVQTQQKQHHTAAPMGVSAPHPCNWGPRGGTEAGKQFQIARYNGTIASPGKNCYRCTGCGQEVVLVKTL
jgi:hypothetical protein